GSSPRTRMPNTRHGRRHHWLRLAGPGMSGGGRYNRLSGDARRRLSFDNPFVWEVARTIEYPEREGSGGRPNQYPLWVFFLWLVLIHEYGSSRKVEEAFEDPTHGP